MAGKKTDLIVNRTVEIASKTYEEGTKVGTIDENEKIEVTAKDGHLHYGQVEARFHRGVIVTREVFEEQRRRKPKPVEGGSGTDTSNE